MVPSNRWFPTSLQEQAAWLANFVAMFAQVAAQLGFTAADVDAVTRDYEDFQFCASTAVELEAFMKAFRRYRKLLAEGRIGSQTPAYPPNPVSAPPNAVPAGIFERLDRLVTRIKVSDAYTPEIGSLLGIIPVTPAKPANPQPVLKAESLPGSVVEVKFTRGQTDGIALELQVDNSGTWTPAGRFYRSPASLTIPQNNPNLPRSVKVRARYVDGNTPVGQFSPVVSTSTQPAD